MQSESTYFVFTLNYIMRKDLSNVLHYLPTACYIPQLPNPSQIIFHLLGPTIALTLRFSESS